MSLAAFHQLRHLCQPFSSSGFLWASSQWRFLHSSVSITALIRRSCLLTKGDIEWHQHRLSYQYWLGEEKTNWRYVEMELVTSYPVYSFNEQKRFVKAEYLTGAWIALLFAAALIIYTVEGFNPFTKPQFSRIDVFDTLGNFPGYLGPIHAMLWSGPLYTFLLFKSTTMLELVKPYAFFVEWVCRFSDRRSPKRFEENWRSIFGEKGLSEKPPTTWRFHHEEERRFTEMPKRVERKGSRYVPITTVRCRAILTHFYSYQNCADEGKGTQAC